MKKLFANLAGRVYKPLLAKYLSRTRPVTIYLSDLFADIPEVQFDFIAINPPYYRKHPSSHAEYAWYCGKGGEYFDRLFQSIGSYLHPGSRVLIILSEVCDLDMIHAFAKKHGWLLKIVQTHQNWIERLILYELVGVAQ